jgi:hypothetical protein
MRWAARAGAAGAVAAATTPSRRKLRYLLNIKTNDKPWAAAGAAAMRDVFGRDALGKTTAALFQAALQPRTYENYGSNLRSF